MGARVKPRDKPDTVETMDTQQLAAGHVACVAVAAERQLKCNKQRQGVGDKG